MQTYDVVILGGGAAGLMCAIIAGQRGRRVLVLEGSNKIGKKILMSGGGRCNFTNLNCTPANFVSGNSHFCVSALSRYSPEVFVELVEKYGIAYHEKAAGQLFCDQSSKDILSMLVKECVLANVDIVEQCAISSVTHADKFSVATDKGEFTSASLVVATGGLSIPKMGASGFGYQLARQFGLNVLETRAGLVPFMFTGSMQEMTGRLSGISLRACLSSGKTAFTDDILFTHRGLSGPAALQLSSFWIPGSVVELDLMPGEDASLRLLQAKQSQPRSLIRSILSDNLSRALVMELQALFWVAAADVPLAEISDDQLRRIGKYLNAWQLKPSGTEGYRTAEVTLGGVNTDELSSRTMESKRQPGLYFIGEVVDVTGHLGGFNFQWAWASAQAAGAVA